MLWCFVAITSRGYGMVAGMGMLQSLREKSPVNDDYTSNRTSYTSDCNFWSTLTQVARE